MTSDAGGHRAYYGVEDAVTRKRGGVHVVWMSPYAD